MDFIMPLLNREGKMNTRVKLSKKVFYALDPGNFIMNNTFPIVYDEITNKKEILWEKWRSNNGRMVNIFNNKEDCLKEWWSRSGQIRSNVKEEYKTKEIYRGPLSKKIFYKYMAGHYLLFLQEPFDVVELRENRDTLWGKYAENSGLMVMIFKNQVDALMTKIECCPE